METFDGTSAEAVLGGTIPMLVLQWTHVLWWNPFGGLKIVDETNRVKDGAKRSNEDMQDRPRMTSFAPDGSSEGAKRSTLIECVAHETPVTSSCITTDVQVMLE